MVLRCFCVGPDGTSVRVGRGWLLACYTARISPSRKELVQYFGQLMQRFPAMKYSPSGESSLGEERGNADCGCLTFGKGNGRTLPSLRLDRPETGG